MSGHGIMAAMSHAVSAGMLAVVLATQTMQTACPKDSPTTRHAAVAFTVATYGINVPGTVYRMDDVPIPLRPAFDSPFPSDFEILTGIERRVKELKAVANGLPVRRASLRPVGV